MPLFSKSKTEKQPPKSAGGYQYPTQQPAYPTQPSAPAGYAVPGDQPPPYTPQAQYGAPGAPQYAPGAPQYAPPQAGQRPAYYPQQPQYASPYGYPQQYPAAMAYPLHPGIPAGAQVLGQGTFDAGARFNAGGSTNIPPPPPGAMPNAAQIAFAHGGTVTMNQAKGGFFSGGSDGGVSTHID